MSIKVYVNTSNKKAETSALLDSGATENFITTHYANWLRLPIKQLPRARKVCNVDGTTNKQGDITHFTNLEVQTGTKRIKMRFFLTDLGEQKVILGYPWFAAMQPRVNWARAWIDYKQLPVVLRTPDAHKAVFTPVKDRLSRVKASFRNLTKKLRKIQDEDRMFVTRVYVCHRWHLHQSRGRLGAWVSRGNQPLGAIIGSVSTYLLLWLITLVLAIVCRHLLPLAPSADVPVTSTYVCVFWTLPPPSI